MSVESGMTNAQIDAVFKIINQDNKVYFIAHDYLRSRSSTDGLMDVDNGTRCVTTDGALVASIMRNACLDYLQHDSKSEAKKLRQRASTIEQTLRVLGMTEIPTTGFVLNRMKPDDLAAIDPHFRSLVRGLGDDLDAIRPLTALMQMVIDLRTRASYLQSLRKDRAFFFYLGKRFAQVNMRPPLKAHVMPVYTVLDEALKKAIPGSKGLPSYPYKDYRKVRNALAQGSKAATI